MYNAAIGKKDGVDFKAFRLDDSEDDDPKKLSTYFHGDSYLDKKKYKDFNEYKFARENYDRE